MSLKAKTLHNSVKAPAPEHAVCVRSNLYMTELFGICKFLHICFPADLSLYLLLKVYVQGILWGRLHSSTCNFFSSVRISSMHVSVFHQLWGCLSLCPSCVSSVHKCLFQKSHTSNKFWSACMLLCVFLFVYLWIYVHGNTCDYLWNFFCKLHVNYSMWNCGQVLLLVPAHIIFEYI